MEEVVRVSKSFERLCVLVLDGSGSMEDLHPQSGVKKAEAISQIVRDLITALKAHRESPNMFMTILTYDDRIDGNPIILPTPVVDMDENADYNPMNLNGVMRGGQTAIGDVLEEAFNEALNFTTDPSQQYPRTAIILLMTDGNNNAGKDPRQVSQEIHQKLIKGELKGKIRRICALGFGDPNDKESLDADLLRGIVTEPADGPKGNFKLTMEPPEIVDFFLRSITK